MGEVGQRPAIFGRSAKERRVRELCEEDQDARRALDECRAEAGLQTASESDDSDLHHRLEGERYRLAAQMGGHVLQGQMVLAEASSDSGPRARVSWEGDLARLMRANGIWHIYI